MADAVIGRADYQVGADTSPLTAGLKGAESQLKATGANIEKSALSTGTAFKAAGALATGGFALMTKGALDMQAAQGKFQAATGLSHEKAVLFSKDMNGLVGSSGAVGQSFEDIAAVGTTVSQQFGTTGQDTQDLTEKILEFSKVTGGDANDNAGQLEDTLSSYGLSAKDASGFMDQLVASNQKFGLDAGPETLGVLQKIGPAMQELGGNIEDSTALLSAYEQEAIPATNAQKDLNTAITKLPKGTSINDLITQLGKIQDPAERSRKAVELLGTKAGLDFAKIIKPGMTSLDDWKVSADDAKDATRRASDDMLTDADKVKQFADKAGAALRGLGQDFGPALSGLAGLGTAFGTIGSTLHLDDFAKALKGKIGGALKSAFTGAHEVIGTALANAWSNVKNFGKDAINSAAIFAGNVYSKALDVAQAIKFKIEDAWDAAKGLAGRAIGAAAEAAAAAYRGALTLARAVADGLSTAWDFVSDVGRAGIKAVIDNAGKAAGLVYAASAFVVSRLADAANVAWGFLEGAAQGAAQKAGGVLGKLFGEGFGDNVVSTTTGAVGTIIGNLSGNAIQTMTTKWEETVLPWLSQGFTGKIVGGLQGVWQRLASNSLVTGAVAAAGAAWGAIEGTASAIASAGADVIRTWLAKFAALLPVKVAAATAAGTAEGLAEGDAAAVALTGPGILAKLTLAGAITAGTFGAAFKQKLLSLFPSGGAGVFFNLKDFLPTGSLFDIQPWERDQAHRLGITLGDEVGTSTGAAIAPALTSSGINAFTGFATAVKPIASGLGTDTGHGFSDAWIHTVTTANWKGAAEMAMESAANGAAMDHAAQTMAGNVTGAFKSSIINQAHPLGQAVAEAIGKGVYDNASDVAAVFQKLGTQTPGAFSKGIVDGLTGLTSGLDRLKTTIKNALSPAETKAEVLGVLTAKALAQGLADARPEVHLQAEQVALDGIAQLHRLDAASPQIGKAAMKLLANATEAEKPTIRAALEQILGVTSDELDQLVTNSGKAGTNSGDALATNLKKKKGAAVTATDAIKTGIENKLATIDMDAGKVTVEPPTNVDNIVRYINGVLSGIHTNIKINVGTGRNPFPEGAGHGGRRALGGPVKANTMYQVDEGGRPELLGLGGKTYLMMGAASGYVTALGNALAPRSAPALAGAGGTTVININNPVIRRDADIYDMRRELERVGRQWNRR